MYLRSLNEDYKFPIGTNIITGKLLRKLIKQFMYSDIPLEKYSRIWIDSYYISDDTILIYDNESVTLFTNEWAASEEDGLTIPTIVTVNITSPILYIE